MAESSTRPGWDPDSPIGLYRLLGDPEAEATHRTAALAEAHRIARVAQLEFGLVAHDLLLNDPLAYTREPDGSDDAMAYEDLLLETAEAITTAVSDVYEKYQDHQYNNPDDTNLMLRVLELGPDASRDQVDARYLELHTLQLTIATAMVNGVTMQQAYEDL